MAQIDFITFFHEWYILYIFFHIVFPCTWLSFLKFKNKYFKEKILYMCFIKKIFTRDLLFYKYNQILFFYTHIYKYFIN